LNPDFRFGLVPCILVNHDVKAGEEIFVHYGYDLQGKTFLSNIPNVNKTENFIFYAKSVLLNQSFLFKASDYKTK
jgi:hypothetical protein